MRSTNSPAEKRNYDDNIHPGRYIIQDCMSNRALVNLLSSGRQTPVKVTFNNIRTKNDFAGKIGGYLEADSIDFIHYFDTSAYFKTNGLNSDNLTTLFIPNTYELYWNTSAGEFVERMAAEHDKFWNKERKNQANIIGLSQRQIYILASIVYAESKQSSEAKRIAGVYINRLKKNMLLQADPTVVYAIGDLSIKRVLNTDLQVDSPYNTYKYSGLPPGPIHMPPINFIDAVLNYEPHNYIYMCARGDGSGTHYFAKTLTEHNLNRSLYIQALNKQGIYR